MGHFARRLERAVASVELRDTLLAAANSVEADLRALAEYFPDWQDRLVTKRFTRGRHNDARFVRWQHDDVSFTAEVVAVLGPLPPESVAGWQSLLERCDVARFTNLGFTAGEWTNALDQARHLIAASLPVGEVADSAAGGPTGEKA